MTTQNLPRIHRTMFVQPKVVETRGKRRKSLFLHVFGPNVPTTKEYTPRWIAMCFLIVSLMPSCIRRRALPTSQTPSWWLRASVGASHLAPLTCERWPKRRRAAARSTDMKVSVLFWTQGKRDAPGWSDCHLVMLSVAQAGMSLVVALLRTSLGARLVCVSELCNSRHVERASDHSPGGDRASRAGYVEAMLRSAFSRFGRERRSEEGEEGGWECPGPGQLFSTKEQSGHSGQTLEP